MSPTCQSGCPFKMGALFVGFTVLGRDSPCQAFSVVACSCSKCEVPVISIYCCHVSACQGRYDNNACIMQGLSKISSVTPKALKPHSSYPPTTRHVANSPPLHLSLSSLLGLARSPWWSPGALLTKLHQLRGLINSSCSSGSEGQGALNKMLTGQAIHRLNAVPIRMFTAFFTDIEKQIWAKRRMLAGLPVQNLKYITELW